MKGLTKAEEQIMQYLWKLKKCFLKDIVDIFPEPKPAYTTVSTVIRVLVKKKYIGFKTYGKIHEYFPLVKKSDYFSSHLKTNIREYFNGSVSNFTSFFASDKDIDISDLEEIKRIIDEQIKIRKKNG
jgi:predicted transcriptional regulator